MCHPNFAPHVLSFDRKKNADPHLRRPDQRRSQRPIVQRVKRLGQIHTSQQFSASLPVCRGWNMMKPWPRNWCSIASRNHFSSPCHNSWGLGKSKTRTRKPVCTNNGLRCGKRKCKLQTVLTKFLTAIVSCFWKLHRKIMNAHERLSKTKQSVLILPFESYGYWAKTRWLGHGFWTMRPWDLSCVNHVSTTTCMCTWRARDVQHQRASEWRDFCKARHRAIQAVKTNHQRRSRIRRILSMWQMWP